jgi:acetyl-CoA acetyltransferase
VTTGHPVSIVGVGWTGYTRESGRTARSYAIQAALNAIKDAGLTPSDIDGVVSSAGMGSPMIVAPGAVEMVSALGIPEVRWFSDGNPVIGGPIIDAVNALRAGAARTVLVFHYNYRSPYNSAKLASDPFRRNIAPYAYEPPESPHHAAAYALWTSRFLREQSVTREHLGLVAVNSRSHAQDNPLAAIRTPLDIDGYLDARQVREPLGMYDMDLPVDGAEAYVLTRSAEASAGARPVTIDAAVTGLVAQAADEDQLPSLGRHGQDVVVTQLRNQVDFAIEDIDLAYVYDGFTTISLSWFLKLGWSPHGGLAGFLADNWNKDLNQFRLQGRVPVNPQGGMLSEGGTQGAGFVRDAVRRLREPNPPGLQPVTEVPPRKALLAIGGFFYNSQALVLSDGSARTREGTP